MSKYYALAFLGVFLTTASQALLKAGADRAARRHFLWTYANPFSVFAYILLGSTTLINLYAFRVLPLKVSSIISPFTYIFIGVYAHYMLKERLTAKQVFGALLVIMGVIVFNIPAP